MADRAFHNSYRALELEVVHLYAKVTIGGTGAPTLVTASSKGVASVVRNSAGEYKVTLSDKYSALLWGSASILTTTGSDPATVGVVARLEVDSVTAATPYVQFQCYALDDGAAADPASGATFLIKLELKNTSV
jgi:hypothetical protein